MGVLQKEYKEKIAAIRAICYSFAQGPLHQSLNGGESSLAPAFRKYSTVLKVTPHNDALRSIDQLAFACGMFTHTTYLYINY